jgi:hypothetical protein
VGIRLDEDPEGVTVDLRPVVAVFSGGKSIKAIWSGKLLVWPDPWEDLWHDGGPGAQLIEEESLYGDQ